MLEIVFLLAANIASPTASVPFHEGQPPWQGSQDVALDSFPLMFLMRSLNSCLWMVPVSSIQPMPACPLCLECLYLPQLAGNCAIHESPSPTLAPWLPFSLALPSHSVSRLLKRRVFKHELMVTLSVLVLLMGYDTPGQSFPLPLSCHRRVWNM